MAEYGQQLSVGLLEVIMQELLEAKQTGILTIQRSKAGVRDVGTITILHGEPVEAYAQDRLGNDAIQWLYTWGRCQCEFLPKAPADIVIAPPPPPAAEVDTPLSPLAFLSRLRVGRNQETNEPGQTTKPERPERPDKTSRPDRTDRIDEPVIEQLPFTPNVVRNPPRSLPETPMPPSRQPLPTPPPFRVTQGSSDVIFSEWLQNGNQPKEQAPQRLWQGQDALTFLERARASRLHRHVFLLLDGQRTIPDLVRITGHSPEEIKRLLNDLERLGIIKQGHEVQAGW